MARGFRIEVKGADRLIKALQKAGDQVAKEVEAELRYGAEDVEDIAGQLVPSDEGLLRSSIRSDRVEGNSKKVIYQVGVFAPYAGYVEFGTGGKVDIPSGWEREAAKSKNAPSGSWQEFINALTEWVKRKGLVGTYSIKAGQRGQQTRTDRGRARGEQDAYARQIAFLIARKIYKEGLRPRPFLRPAFEQKRQEIIDRVKTVLKDIRL